MPFRIKFFSNGRMLDAMDVDTPKSQSEAEAMARWNCLEGETFTVEWVGPNKPPEPPKPVQKNPQVVLEMRVGRSVSIDKASELLQVSRRTIYNWIRDGRLQTVRTLGGSQRVVIESLRDSTGVAADSARKS